MIIIIIILICIIFLLTIKSTSRFTNKGYANINDRYTKPIVKPNIITPTEAQNILEKASKSFEDSKILSGTDTNIRKSQTTWIYPSDNIHVYNIINRICKEYNYPFENAEPLQVVKYEPGGFYNDHHDSCCDDNPKCDEFIQKSGQRVLTVLIYLNDNFTDGGTQFTELNEIIKPNKYSGIIFRPLADDSSQCHPLALHKGMPVTSGVKYVCNIWIREKSHPHLR